MKSDQFLAEELKAPDCPADFEEKFNDSPTEIHNTYLEVLVFLGWIG